jgi:poly(3-hydroxyalkanoate) synthetase
MAMLDWNDCRSEILARVGEIGIQVFCVSWRNPTAKERDWALDTYVAALDEGTDAVREITGFDDVTMMGACSGGSPPRPMQDGSRARAKRRLRISSVRSACSIWRARETARLGRL